MTFFDCTFFISDDDIGIEAKDLEFELLDKRLHKLETVRFKLLLFPISFQNHIMFTDDDKN